MSTNDKINQQRQNVATRVLDDKKTKFVAENAAGVGAHILTHLALTLPTLGLSWPLSLGIALTAGEAIKPLVRLSLNLGAKVAGQSSADIHEFGHTLKTKGLVPAIKLAANNAVKRVKNAPAELLGTSAKTAAEPFISQKKANQIDSKATAKTQRMLQSVENTLAHKTPKPAPRSQKSEEKPTPRP
jgi:hypothetical protein